MQSTKTQRAHQLWKEIQGRKRTPPSIGLYKHSFLKGYIWISYNQRAYFLKDLGNSHLINTIKSQEERHPEANIKPLRWELRKRYLLTKRSKLV